MLDAWLSFWTCRGKVSLTSALRRRRSCYKVCVSEPAEGSFAQNPVSRSSWGSNRILVTILLYLLEELPFFLEERKTCGR